ncbi:unnamed protein product, partial [Polarella glacialis]
VIVGSALLGPLPQQEQPDVQVQSVAPPCFVRLWMDGEFVGETSVFGRGYTSRPVWNERFLLIPRASRCTRFEVVEATECPTVRCHCALGTESLWRTATCGVPLSMDVPLLHYGEEAVGSLRIHARIWDGLPLQDTPWWPTMTDVPSMSQFVAQPVAQQPPQVNLSSPVASAAQVFSSRFVAPTIPPPTWTQSLPA